MNSIMVPRLCMPSKGARKKIPTEAISRPQRSPKLTKFSKFEILSRWKPHYQRVCGESETCEKSETAETSRLHAIPSPSQQASQCISAGEIAKPYARKGESCALCTYQQSLNKPSPVPRGIEPCAAVSPRLRSVG